MAADIGRIATAPPSTAEDAVEVVAQALLAWLYGGTVRGPSEADVAVSYMQARTVVEALKYQDTLDNIERLKTRISNA